MDPLPPAFLERLARIVPDAALPGVLASFAAPKRTTLRLNPLLAAPDAILGELVRSGFALEPLPGFHHAFTLADEAQRAALTSSPAVVEGRAYLQNPSSMLAPLALSPAPEESVLDLCAAPGGKTLLLAVLMEGRGRLSAVEPVRNRFFKLQANLTRGGAHFVRTFMRDGRGVGRACPEWFTRVLLDAPCSSEARFRADDPDSWSHWAPRKVREASRRQHGLLEAAADALAPGGTLLYSTCSFAPEENEIGLSELLARRPELECVPLPPLPPAPLSPAITAWEDQPIHPSLCHARRVLPDACFDGFFLGLLRKNASSLAAGDASPGTGSRRPPGRKPRR